MIKRIISSLILLALAVAVPLYAQKVDTLATTNIVVKSIRGEEKTPVTQKTITIEALSKHDFGQEMPILINTTPSITSYSENGAYNGYTYLRLRGLDMTRINMTLNGVPLNEPEDQGVYFSNFPDFAHSISSVQIQRGVGTSSNGTAAYAGSVNFASVNPWETRRGLEYSHNQNVAGDIAFTLGPVATFVRGTKQHVNGYRDHSDNRSNSGYLVSDYIREKSMVRLVAFSGVADNQLAYLASPLSVIRYHPTHNASSEKETDHFAQQFVSSAFTLQPSSKVTLNATGYYIGLQGHYGILIDDVWDFNLKSQWFGFLTTASYTGNNTKIDWGTNGNTYYRDHFLYVLPDKNTRVYNNRGTKDELSTFVKLEHTFDKLTIMGDVQHRDTRFNYTPDRNAMIFPLEAVRWSFTNPKVGMSFATTKNTKLYTSFGQNMREPTRSDMFAGFDNIDSSNVSFIGSLSRVKPERVRDWEAGVEYRSKRFAAQANIFNMQFHNEIAPIGQLSYIGLPLRKNVESSYRRGVEVDGSIDIGRFTVESNASLITAKIREYTDDVTGQTYHNVAPLLTPRVTSNNSISYRFGVARATVANRYVGKSYLDNTVRSEYILPSATLFDVRADVDLWVLTFAAQLNNIFDRLTFSSGYVGPDEPYYYVNMGRNLNLSARLNF